MKSKLKKIMGLAMAAAFAVSGACAFVPAAANTACAHEQHAEGGSNVYSQRIKEETERHDSAVRAIRHEYRRDSDEQKYRRRMKEEQERHDRAMETIRHDYDSHARHGHH